MQEIKDQPPKVPKKPLFFYYIIALIVVMLLNALLFPSMLSEQVTQVSFDQFLSMVDEGQVSQVAWETEEEQLVFIAKKEDGQDAYYKTGVWPDTGEWLLEKLNSTPGIQFEASIPTQASPLLSFIVSWVLPIFVFILIGELLSRWMLKQMGGQMPGMGNAMTFGKANAKVYVEQAQTGVTFADVAGQEEAKDALMEVVDFLHDPDKYAARSAPSCPRACCWSARRAPARPCWPRRWPERPGCPSSPSPGRSSWRCSWAWGRPRSGTCSSRPMRRPPASCSSTRSTPSARSGTARGMGGNDEREQTLNQLLAEMDGFDGQQGRGAAGGHQPAGDAWTPPSSAPAGSTGGCRWSCPTCRAGWPF